MIVEVYRKNTEKYQTTLYGITGISVVADVYQLTQSKGYSALYSTETYELKVRCE